MGSLGPGAYRWVSHPAGGRAEVVEDDSEVVVDGSGASSMISSICEDFGGIFGVFEQCLLIEMCSVLRSEIFMHLQSLSWFWGGGLSRFKSRLEGGRWILRVRECSHG